MLWLRLAGRRNLGSGGHFKRNLIDWVLIYIGSGSASELVQRVTFLPGDYGQLAQDQQ